MKSLIFIVLLLISATTTVAKQDCADCEKTPPGLPSSGGSLDGVAKIAKFSPNKLSLRKLAQSICITYKLDRSKMVQNIHRRVKNYMVKYAGYNTTSKKYIIKFLNQNKDDLTCWEDKKNYMFVAFDNAAHDQVYNLLFFDQLLLEDEEYYVDENAVSFIKGEAFTVLD